MKKPILFSVGLWAIAMLLGGKIWGQEHPNIGSIVYSDDLSAYEINSTNNLKDFAVYVNGSGSYTTGGAENTAHDCTGMTFKITGLTMSANGMDAITKVFKGTFTAKANTDGTFPVVTDLNHPLFKTATDAIISNIMLKKVTILQDESVGAIACTANGASRIYNCGILPTTPKHTTADRSTVGSSNNKNCGGLVGYLNETARVINCFSYADVVKGGGSVGGLVGNNGQTSTQSSMKTIVVNCIFYGDINITGCNSYSPVFGNKDIDNSTDTGINPYCFFSAKDGTFANSSFNGYKHSWPVAEEYLTRFEYYRSIFNSNRLLCTWWVDGTNETAPTDADVARVGIAKWVLDESIAPYPILKEWGKYPCITNPDPEKVWDTATGAWVQRVNAAPYKGKSLGTLTVTVKPGNHASDAVMNTYGANGKTITLTITDMDTLHYDYGYYKVQLPYYNEQFGNSESNDHTVRYGGNYKDYHVVTGWRITSVTGGIPGTFKGYSYTNNYGGYGNITPDVSSTEAWEDGFDFADRQCTNKDLYSKSGRVFAQGGYYYVPEGVTAITIEAYWGTAVYLHNTEHYIDRVKMTNQSANGSLKLGNPFKPAGKLDGEFHDQMVYDNWNTAVKNLPVATLSDNKLSLTVYDQAVVLLSNFQIRNENNAVGTDLDGGKFHPYTIMSIDQDLDNEPDYCFEFQFRQAFGRPPIQPIRFDFLPVPELGMAVRHNTNQNTIGIFIPQGHFEITETSYMHTTQFEYDYGTNSSTQKPKVEAPVILNGGHFEQIVVRRGVNQKTSYFIMGGHFKMLRFTPGAHVTPDNTIRTRHCAVNAIGGDYPEFYLSGIYKANQPAHTDNPHCYTNGGHFGIIAGAGYEKVDGDVTFKIDHSVIREFYGGGINGTNPISGSIDVTINNSLVNKYCGGPKLGVMSVVNNVRKTVTTHATGTTFTKYYGGGNGGTSYYREGKYDGNTALPASNASAWINSTLSPNPGFKTFNPLNTISDVAYSYEGTGNNKGYHALFEFECFVESNGIGGTPTVRTYLHWAQFGTTITGDVTNVLKDCIIKTNFYGGGNLGNVEGRVVSTLNNCEIKGNVFGGGYSGKIEPFRIHDKSTAKFPYVDRAGVMHDGMNSTESCEYLKNDNGSERYYTWCYKNTSGQMFPQGVQIPSNANTGEHATFEYPEGSNKWYVLTTVSLEGLGAVSNDVELNLIGTTKVGTDGDLDTGNVFGGGNESAVDGSAMITISGSAEVLQNVFGGGNQASVGINTTGTPGNTTVKLKEGARVLGNVFGGGNEGPVGGNSEVIIQDAP